MQDRCIVSIEQFFEEYKEFYTEEYQDICLQAFRRAKVYINPNSKGRLCGEKRKLAIYLLTAHIAFLTNKSKSEGQAQAGIVSQASVGEVSVSFVQVPNLDQWSYWLNLTPYGMELLTLLETLTSVPFYVGGSLERVF